MFNLVPANAHNLKSKCYIFIDSFIWQQLEVLENDANLAPEQWYLAVFELVVVNTAHHNFAA